MLRWRWADELMSRWDVTAIILAKYLLATIVIYLFVDLIKHLLCKLQQFTAHRAQSKDFSHLKSLQSLKNRSLSLSKVECFYKPKLEREVKKK